MRKVLLWALCINNFAQSFFLAPKHHYFTTTISIRPSNKGAGTRLNAIEVPSLNDIDDNHEKEAIRLANSITGWLDEEWIPQEVHVQMADCVEKVYIKARNDGETEVSVHHCAIPFLLLFLSIRS